LVERWRHEYNTFRPHTALGYRLPAPEAIEPKTAPGVRSELVLKPGEGQSGDPARTPVARWCGETRPTLRSESTTPLSQPSPPGGSELSGTFLDQLRSRGLILVGLVRQSAFSGSIRTCDLKIGSRLPHLAAQRPKRSRSFPPRCRLSRLGRGVDSPGPTDRLSTTCTGCRVGWSAIE
jgi:hypothetical protein